MATNFNGSHAFQALREAENAKRATALRDEVTRGVIDTHIRKIEAGEEELPAKGFADAYAYEIEQTIKMVQEYRRKKARREAKAKA